MKLEPLTPNEVRKLRKAHEHSPQCLTCMQPQRCIIGMLLDTLAQKCPDFGDTAAKTPPPPAEFYGLRAIEAEAALPSDSEPLRAALRAHATQLHKEVARYQAAASVETDDPAECRQCHALSDSVDGHA